MNNLSDRQQSILKFIKKEVNQKGYPPSVREIGEAVGLASSSTVHGHLSRLEKKGFIRRDPTKPRAIEILEKASQEKDNSNKVKTVDIPVVGKVTAGQPITAVENIDEYIPIPDRFIPVDGQSFMLVVEGDSMIDAGIYNNDYVVVHQQNTASNGDIVVAMTEDEEATVKRFFKENNHIRLQPENVSLEPIRLDEVTILGKVVAVFRSLQ